ncbi:hypothetical protein [Rhodohalobacter mucosus]|uniref:Uncharacterized protein n=1 Tax=Rhodohalobacter mucosus TaxID=2079485 RepID=A0A316TX73_9BACT|nr:hypothetical protein [Rhodohalobacter mucosus]PWN07232.1 hypothetical protein DDZ15_05380 [Rhodohalobacter mucosus]
MRTFKRITTVSILFIHLVIVPALAAAQPAPGQLADMILEMNADRLSGIEAVEITVEAQDNIIPASTTRYVKQSENGRVWLRPENEDPEIDSGLLSGVFDDQLPILISGAESIENDQFNNFSVYRVFIDDADLLNTLVSDDIEFEDTSAEMSVRSATVWLDREELIARKLRFVQGDDSGKEFIVDILMEDYQMHSGLPVAHTVTFQFSGMETEFTDEEIAEARRGLEAFRQQLEQMPEAQRKMIEEQMKPQIERMESILDTGEIGDMVFLVQEVRVNP